MLEGPLLFLDLGITWNAVPGDWLDRRAIVLGSTLKAENRLGLGSVVPKQSLDGRTKVG
jgi:hypothetical protein